MATSALLRHEYENLEWVNVSSSNLEAVAYVAGIGRLWVRFVRKPNTTPKYSVCVYEYVPQRVYDALLAAPSHGTYFSANVRNVYAVIPQPGLS